MHFEKRFWETGIESTHTFQKDRKFIFNKKFERVKFIHYRVYIEMSKIEVLNIFLAQKDDFFKASLLLEFLSELFESFDFSHCSDSKLFNTIKKLTIKIPVYNFPLTDDPFYICALSAPLFGTFFQILLSLFLYAFFLLGHFHVAFFSYCTRFMLHFFRVALFSICFFVLHIFHVALSSCCTAICEFFF